MKTKLLDEAQALVEEANASLEPELLSAAQAREQLHAYARIEKLAAFGKAALATRLDDVPEVARATGVSMGKARATVDAGSALKDADEVREALKGGAISLDQAK
jgi:hypothetical protein